MHDSGEVAFKLTITRNKTGPSFVPWEAPAVVGSRSELHQIVLHLVGDLSGSLWCMVTRDLRTPESKNFSISKLYPIRSKAFRQIYEIKAEMMTKGIEIREPSMNHVKPQYIVEVPFRHPNWFGSTFSLTSSINQVTEKSFKDLGQTSSQRNGSSVAFVCGWSIYYIYKKVSLIARRNSRSLIRKIFLAPKIRIILLNHVLCFCGFSFVGV